jgi:SAM-dependent methyltransferase
MPLNMSLIRFKVDEERSQSLEHQRKRNEIVADIDRRFDAGLGLDTGGMIHEHDLNGIGNNWEHTNRYEAVPPEILRAGVDATQVVPSDFTFLDVGSGKGRAIIIARDCGFKRVIGIEFSRMLAEICRRNIDKVAASGRDCSSLEIHCLDACDYELPKGPLLIYFGNPFDAVVMTKFCLHLANSLVTYPRALRIVYFNPTCEEVLLRAIDDLRRTSQSKHFPYFGIVSTYAWDPKNGC